MKHGILLLILIVGLLQTAFAIIARYSISTQRSVCENNLAHLSQNPKAVTYLNEILDPIENKWMPVTYSGLIVSASAAYVLFSRRTL